MQHNLPTHLLLVTIVVFLAPIGCGGGTDVPGVPAASINENGEDSNQPTGNSAAPATLTQEPQAGVSPAAASRRESAAPEVVIKTNFGTLTVQLNTKKAPVTVDNFVTNYVEPGTYDGTIFHYLESNVMACAGGYDAQLQARPTHGAIFNEAHNGLKNKKGTIAMARHPDYVNSATSQFFFNLADNPSLDHVGTGEGQEYGYCVFGQITQGMDVLEKINQAQVADTGGFVNVTSPAVVIESITRVK
ncbi:MAG: cyclophilin family peptidyl-prolyl cis-trans isomerase [Pirellulaceae bacterium]|jgi:cyclophilin family peptidyl-prolyl cis-trans isomerase